MAAHIYIKSLNPLLNKTVKGLLNASNILLLGLGAGYMGVFIYVKFID